MRGSSSGHRPLTPTPIPIEAGARDLFLLSDGASYITGAHLAVDGGWLA
jgi:NAD(P)-dependent dehydrogenase (short-subunit alcohol dehydrogenase family)